MSRDDDETTLDFIVDSIEANALDDSDDFDFDPETAEILSDSGSDPDINIEDNDEAQDPVAQALKPGAPLFLLHKSHQHSAILPAVAADIAGKHGGALHVGVAASVPRSTPQSLKRFFESMPAATLRFADPEAFARHDSLGPYIAAQRDEKPLVGRTGAHWSYFGDPQIGGRTATWVQDVLDTQRSVGASVLLTPGVWADPTSAPAALSEARQHAAWARAALTPGEHLAVNITLSSQWLTNVPLRDKLLNEILDMDETVFYIRVRWPLMPQTYGQLLDEAILDGYVELANVFEDNDKVLILPNTGLTGWAALAWGAHGYSTGIGSGERAFADTRVIRMKRTNPRPAPTNRTFVTDILHVTDVTTANQLDQLSGNPCRCRFCASQRKLAQWNKELAGAHYLRQVADLTATISTSARGRRAGARRIVRAAANQASTAGQRVPLAATNEPKHLALWSARLR